MAVFLLWAFISALSPGRNGVYDGIGTSDLKKGMLKAYGGYESLANYKTQNELVVILRDATIETAEAVMGTYVVEAEDGVCYDRVDVNIVETLPTAMLPLPNMSLGIGIADRSYPLLNHSLIETSTQSPTSTPSLGIEKITDSISAFIVFIKKDIRWVISITIAIFILIIGLTNIRMEYEKKKKEHQERLINKNSMIQGDTPEHEEDKMFLYEKIKRKLKEFVVYMKNYVLSLRILSWVMLILSIMAIIDYIFLFFELHYVHLGVLVSALGITASILIFEKKRVGLILALIWSALQFLSLQIDSFGFNFIQFLDLRFYFSIGGADFGINLFAIVLFCLFFIKRNELDI